MSIEMKLPKFFTRYTKTDWKGKYEYEKARADAAEKELVKLVSDLQETVNGFSIFRGGLARKEFNKTKHHIE